MANAPVSASPTGRTANSSVSGGYTSSRVYLQLPSMNFSSPTTASSTPPPKEDVQESIYLFATACDNFGLVINTEKTVVMHQPPPDAACVAPQIDKNCAQLQAVDNFTYLGSTLSNKIDHEVARRIPKASQDVGRLKNTVWNHHGLHLNTKLKM
ncbi:hypothetical protein SprV_0802645100 [Sparganum proliferum]